MSIGPPKAEQLARMIKLLAPFVKENDCDFSDPDFIRHLDQRYQKAWRAQQEIIDPNE